MTPRERILAAIRHELPDRIPLYVVDIDDPQPYMQQLDLNNPDQLPEHLGLDMRKVKPVWKKAHPDNRNAFGTAGDSVGYGQQTASDHPFARFTTTRQIEAYPWPQPDDWDFSTMPRQADIYEPTYAIGLSGWNPIFCRLLDFFGIEQALIHLHCNLSLIEAAIARLEDFYLRFYRRYFETIAARAHIFCMGDDFATQRGMMISPEHWRRFLKPTYQRIFALARSFGLYIWFHSCGVIRPVLPDLIDIGMDVWETVQTHLPGNEPQTLKRDFGSHITFFGGINTQRTLPFGSPDDVRREARRLIRILGKGGGYICGPDHILKKDVPVSNMLALVDEVIHFRENGVTASA